SHITYLHHFISLLFHHTSFVTIFLFPIFFFFSYFFFFFFFNDTATTEIYTLSLHDALPISYLARSRDHRRPLPADQSSVRRQPTDRKSTRLNSSHVEISYAVFCLKKKKKKKKKTKR